MVDPSALVERLTVAVSAINPGLESWRWALAVLLMAIAAASLA